MIKHGTHVMVSNVLYEDLPSTVFGIVDRIDKTWKHDVRVRVTGFVNKRATSGCYYFYSEDVEQINPADIDWPSAYPSTLLNITDSKKFINAIYGKTNIDKMEDNRMKNQQLINGYKVARINFKGSEAITNFALYDDAIKVDDFVLCMTGHHGEAIGRVVEIVPKNDELEGLDVSYGREVICKIDYSAYEDRKIRLKKISKLKVKMAKKREELNELAVYQALAKDCPEMADMLNELKELL